MARIERDLNRFRQIVRGHIRKNLRKYMARGEMIGRQGKRLVSIPLPQINLPRFQYGRQQAGGVSQGNGEIGEPIGQGDPQPGSGEAGGQPGQHILEAELTIEELAEILGEELELPNIEPRGSQTVITEKDKYTGIRRVGPNSLRHFKRTYKEALRRQISLGIYDPDNPVVVPIRDDMRYRSWREVFIPQSNAVIIYLMDVSGSMGQEQKDMVRLTAFWLETWLRSQYENIEVCYIVHDAVAQEVDKETFYHIREGGGTRISSAYHLCNRIIDERYPVDDWNIYPFQFSDGDNWGHDDTYRCLALLKHHLLPKSNQFCYGQVYSTYGSGRFAYDLRQHLRDEAGLVVIEIFQREDIYDAIKMFLGKGR